MKNVDLLEFPFIRGLFEVELISTPLYFPPKSILVYHTLHKWIPVCKDTRRRSILRTCWIICNYNLNCKLSNTPYDTTYQLVIVPLQDIHRYKSAIELLCFLTRVSIGKIRLLKCMVKTANGRTAVKGYPYSTENPSYSF